MDDREVRALFVVEEAPIRNDACHLGGPATRQRSGAAVRRLRLAWALLACLTLFAAASAQAGPADDELSVAARAASAEGRASHAFSWSLAELPQLLPEGESPPESSLPTAEPEAAEKYARFEALVPRLAHARAVHSFPAIRVHRIASTPWVAQFAESAALPRGPPRLAR